MKLDKYDVALVNGACGDDERARPILQCLHLTKGRIEAANGYMLAIRDLDLEEGEEKPETLVPAKMVKGIKPRKKQQAKLTTDNDSVSVVYQDEQGQPIDFEPTYSFKTYGDGKSYPDIESLFKTSDIKKKAHIAVNVGLLKKLLSTMPEDGHLRIGITEIDKPLEFECSNMDRPIRGLLMPMFIDWDGFKWHREFKEVNHVQEESTTI